MFNKFNSMLGTSCLLAFLFGCSTNIPDTIQEKLPAIITNTLVPGVSSSSAVTPLTNSSSIPIPAFTATPVLKTRQIKEIRITPVPTNIMTGRTLNLKAEVVYTDKSTSKDVIWEVDKNDLASIDSQGDLKGLNNGIIRITAKAKNIPDKSQSIYVRVWNLTSSSSPTWMPTFSSGAGGGGGGGVFSTGVTTPVTNAPQNVNLQVPSGLHASNITSTDFTLTWLAVQGATSYKIYKDSVLYTDNVTTTSKILTGLTGGIVYSMQVSAVNTSGESLKSTALTVTTTPTTTEGLQQWAFSTDDWLASSPALADDGTLYIGGDDGKLYAINPGGTEKWAFTTGGAIKSSPLIGDDGTIYVGSEDKKLYAINPNGTIKWSVTTSNVITSSPTMDSNGTIYVGSQDGNVYAINPDGTIKWSVAAGNVITSSPAIGSDGTVYIGSNDNKFYAINPDGTVKWSATTGGIIGQSSPAIGSDGTVYIGSNDNKLYAINPDGTIEWSVTTGGAIDSSPAIDTDGTIYIGSNDGKLYAINPDGTTKWTFTTNGPINAASPTIGADGLIYIGSSDGKLYAIKPNGTQKWAFTSGWNMGKSSPVIGMDGTLYVGGKKLYSINSSSKGHAAGGWSKPHNNKKK